MPQLKGMILSDGDALEDFLAKQSLEVLHRHYPKYGWHIEAGGGVVKVTNNSLRGKQPWGFVVHMKDLVGDPGLKEIMRAGGELLERYRLSREKKASVADAMDEIKDQYTDATKRLQPEL